VAALALPARGDWADAFRRGMAAVEAKRWDEAARLMQQAAAENPKEGGQVKLYGMRFETYLPHYYLGLAEFQRGDCAAALAAWRASEAQGAVARSGQARAFAQHRAQCEQRTASASTPAPSPTAAPAAAATPARIAPSPTPMPTRAVAAAPSATPTPSATPRATPAPSRPAAPAPTVLTPMKRVPAPRLLAGAAAHFAGRHAEAAAGLEPDPGWSARSRAQALLLRASARFSLHALGGQPASLLDQARGDARRAHALEPGLQPDPRAFSPRFARFWNEANR
jgi:hypothetical protein